MIIRYLDPYNRAGSSQSLLGYPVDVSGVTSKNLLLV